MEYYKNLHLEDIKYIDDDGIQKLEIWRDVEGYEGRYQVSDLGRCKSLSRPRSTGNGGFHILPMKILKQTPDRDSYRLIGLRMPGVNNKGKVHRLVAKAFVPNPENLPEVNHIGLYEDGKEGNKDDNRATSLKWVTHSANLKHALETGLIVRGESHSSSKLTEKEVLEIRASNLSHTKLAVIYNTSRPNITKIIRRYRWTHI